MAVVYKIPAQTIDGYNYPGAVFTLYTGSITFPYYSRTYNYDNTPLMVFLTTAPWGGSTYVVQWASSAPFTDAHPYTYDGKTVYWRTEVGIGGVTFNPDLSAELKDTNTDQNASGDYGAWLMVYGGYTNKYIASNPEFTATADAIREKTGDSSPIEWEDGTGFANAIADIPSGGGGEYDWLGKDAEIVDDDVYDFETTLDNTLYAGWTPSTTAQRACITSVTAKTRAVTDMDDNEYILLWECGADIAYTSGSTNKAKPMFTRSVLIQSLFNRPSSWANIESDNFNSNTCATVLTANFLRYYGTTTGTLTYTWATSYGFYFGAQAATFSPTTGNATITIKTPTFYARCSTTYMSTANAGYIDQANSTVYMKGKLFRIKRDGIFRGSYGLITDMINGNGW